MFEEFKYFNEVYCNLVDINGKEKADTILLAGICNTFPKNCMKIRRKQELHSDDNEFLIIIKNEDLHGKNYAFYIKDKYWDIFKCPSREY